MPIKLIDLNLITVDDGLQSRKGGVNENSVDEYANAMSDGAHFPPGIAYWDNETLWLASGFQRYAAHRISGRAEMELDVRNGSRFDALICSVGENDDHGDRRTNSDKRRSVQLLLDHAQSKDWTNKRIAEMCKVTPQFVGEVKKPEMREQRASAKGEKATKRDPSPGTEVGDVRIIKGKNETVSSGGTLGFGNRSLQNETVSPGETLGQPTDAEARDNDPVLILSTENDRLTARLAVAAMEATDEEKAAAADMLGKQARTIAALTAERNAIRSQCDNYMRENGDLKKQIVRMQNKLDKALERA